ncbi:unnamed protein product, partial [Lampetra planeri]
KKAFFKATVSGEPTPSVIWGLGKGELNEKFNTRYDEKTQEHILEIPNVKPDQAGTYKCIATNEYGEAVCNVTLNITEVVDLFFLSANGQAPQDFRSMLKKT